MSKSNNLILLSAVFQGVRMMTGATSSLYLINKGIAEGEIAALRTLQFFVVFLTDTLLGYVADKYSRRLVILLSILFSSCWLLITSISVDSRLLYLGEIFNALSIATESGVLISMLINEYKKEKVANVNVTKIISKHRLIVSLGMIVGVVSGSFFSLGQLDRLWLLSSCLCASILPFAYFSTPPNRTTLLCRHKSFLNSLKEDRKRVKMMFYDNKIMTSCMISILSSSIFRIIVSYTPLVTRINFPNHDSSYIHALILTLMLLTQSLAGHFKKLFNGSFILIICAILLSLFTLITCSVPHINEVAWIMLSGLLMSLIVCTSGYIHNKITDELRATFDSLLNTASILSSMVLSWVAYINYTSIYSIYKFSFYTFCIALYVAIQNAYQQRATK